MPEELFPEIIVTVTPNSVSKGQMISIQSYIQDRYTKQPIVYKTIFMEILDEDGVPVWPLSAVEVESATISKLISTSDLQSGKKYTVRISPSKDQSPMGFADFKIDNTIIPLALLVPGAMLIPHLLLSTPDSTKTEKTESDVVGPDTPYKIAWLIYRTQLDSKVCPICSPNEGLRFRPDDPNLIKIREDTHYGCRCHYDIISESEEKQIYEAYFRKVAYVAFQQEKMMQVAASAYIAFKKR
ncbi:MAG: hypothetical protein ACRDFB_09785 [Rhabdochlamydiaceae bacterium]